MPREGRGASSSGTLPIPLISLIPAVPARRQVQQMLMGLNVEGNRLIFQPVAKLPALILSAV